MPPTTRSAKPLGRPTSLEDYHPQKPYDLVIANLFSDLIEQHVATLEKWLAPNGILLVSGILERFRDRVFEAAEQAGLFVEEMRLRGPWITATLTKSNWLVVHHAPKFDIPCMKRRKKRMIPTMGNRGIP